MENAVETIENIFENVPAFDTIQIVSYHSIFKRHALN